MAVDNISKFYNAFNAKYDNFKTEQEFRDFLKNAKRENIDNLFGAFNNVYDNFSSADEMISYLGWAEPTPSQSSRSTAETEQVGQVEQPAKPARQIDQTAAAEGRQAFQNAIASRGEVSTKEAYSLSDSTKKGKGNLSALTDALRRGERAQEYYLNDLLLPATMLNDKIAPLLEKMRDERALLTGMTGSGSTLFSLYTEEEPARKMASTLAAPTLITRTISPFGRK